MDSRKVELTPELEQYILDKRRKIRESHDRNWSEKGRLEDSLVEARRQVEVLESMIRNVSSSMEEQVSEYVSLGGSISDL